MSLKQSVAQGKQRRSFLTYLAKNHAYNEVNGRSGDGSYKSGIRFSGLVTHYVQSRHYRQTIDDYSVQQI